MTSTSSKAPADAKAQIQAMKRDIEVYEAQLEDSKRQFATLKDKYESQGQELGEARVAHDNERRRRSLLECQLSRALGYIDALRNHNPGISSPLDPQILTHRDGHDQIIR